MMTNKKILWGGAISANQAEGAYDIEGKGLNSTDVMTSGAHKQSRYVTYIDKNTGKAGKTPFDFTRQMIFPENTIPAVLEDCHYPSHHGTDFYHHYEEDLDLMEEMGATCFRCSINWARIFPNGDESEPNEKGLKFYEKIFTRCKEKHIEPIVTISHFETPLNLSVKYGAWANRSMIDFYLHYCEVIFKRYKGLVKYWMTFNEINLIHHAPWLTAGLMQQDDRTKAQALHYQYVASAKAVLLAKDIDPDMQVGMMLSYGEAYPETCHPLDNLEKMLNDREKFVSSDVMCKGTYPYFILKKYKEKDWILDITKEDLHTLQKGTVSFIGFSYYSSSVSTHKKDFDRGEGNFVLTAKNKYLETSEWGWAIDPIGLRLSLNTLYNRYGLPLMIVENGIGANDQLNEDHSVVDDYRIDYLKQHLQQILKAVDEDGVDVLAYQTWSFTDIISAGTGEIRKRYGLVYVDCDSEGNGSMKRIRKKSFYWFKDFINKYNQIKQ